MVLRKKTEGWAGVAELSMLRFSLGGTRKVRGTTHVEMFGDAVRETRLRWFGHK